MWQDEYEQRVNWEFSELELEEIVAFLEGDTGPLPGGALADEGLRRHDTEDLVEQIVAEAREALVRGGEG